MGKILRKHFYGFITKMTKDRCDAMAAQTAFFIIISSIPMLMFVLSMLQTIEIDGTSILSSMISRLPDTVSNFLQQVFMQKRSTTFTFASLTAITTLWSASSAMFSLVKGINDIFLRKERLSYLRVRGFSIIYTFIFLLAVSVTIVVFVFGDTIAKQLVTDYPKLSTIVNQVGGYVGFIALFFFFMFSFKVIPHRAHINLSNAFIGALISTLGWAGFSDLFSMFVENFSNYASVYGSLAAIIVMMLWLYFCLFIMFISGEIVAWLQISSFKRDIREYHEEKSKEKREKRSADKKMKVYNKALKKHNKKPDKYPEPELPDITEEEQELARKKKKRTPDIDPDTGIPKSYL